MSKIFIAGLLATSSIVSTNIAMAQSDEINLSVKERPTTDYDPAGGRMGSFMVFPSISAGLKANNNIYAGRGVGKQDDVILTVSPSLQASSNWNRHALNLFASAEFGRYDDFQGENYEDFSVGGDARMDVSNGTAFTIASSLSHMHEDRGAPDNPGAIAAPTEYNLWSNSAGFKRDLSVVSLAVDLGYDRFDYRDADLVGGGVFNNDDRDRKKYTYGARVGYEIGENTEAYFRLTGNKIQYDNSTEDGGPLRDSDGYEAVVGASLDVTGKTTFDAFIGKVRQAYDAKFVFDPISEVTFGLNLLWNKDDLTSFIANISREVQETTVLDQNAAGIFVPASGILNSSVSGRIEHAVRRNILLEGGLSYADMDFVGTARQDKLFSGDLGVTYKMNPNWHVVSSYKYENKSTNLDGSRGEYSRNVFMVNVKAQW